MLIISQAATGCNHPICILMTAGMRRDLDGLMENIVSLHAPARCIRINSCRLPVDETGI